MKTCINCQAVVDDNAVVCPYCGTMFAQAAPQYGQAVYNQNSV